MKWLDIPDETKINAYQQVAEKVGIPASVAEKDWWVVRTLQIIFESSIASHLVFKGGTSLSKSWGVIHRFSEDLDLAIDRVFLGFEGSLTKRQRTQLRKAANLFTSNHFFFELQEAFKNKGFENLRFNLVDTTESDQDPKIIEIFYPNLIKIEGLEYIQPRIQIEIGCRSLREPFSDCSVLSYLDEVYAENDFSEGPVIIPSVNPERTLLEKLFLLHEEFHKPEDKIRVERLSRHLYDVYQLANTPFLEKALGDKVLYETIVDHRFNFTKVSNVDYNLLSPKSLSFLPIEKVMNDWERDYRTMRDQMIFQPDAPTFNELIAFLTQLNEQINQLGWSLEKKYPEI
jgi:hypothetical protein